MKYSDGTEISVGDRVKLGEDENGIIIGIICNSPNADNEFSKQWSYLKKGFMAEFPRWGLIHYEEAEDDLTFISRSNPEIPKSSEMRKIFSLGDEVIVSNVGGWKKNSKGIIVSEPKNIDTLQGADFFYWVEFDEPQEDTEDEGHQYSKAQILSRFITKYSA
ncbi:MAG: hypothetical protein KA099_00330 [Alphaproteobacteria bacterium]|nr:hypothetical protein [Alphaproteobacteria bacterium]MBP7758775.1 hypothetical protein [Alphaproteobacteria bacterium]MBP7761803.1 hypothetical protein [Alphaproteobacteria bacterium]MBP7903746.1 hypothetical protein [Alphaproteobacteria bacterium]